MKARRVKGLDPDGELADQLERIVRVRADELFAFMPRAADPARVEHLHDMRIAAKRLRYVLEVAEGSLGPYATTARKRTKQLQDLLGELHDCDVMLPRVLELAERTRQADAAAVRERAGTAKDLDPALPGAAPHADAHRGLASLQTYWAARRELLFDRFLAFWEAMERDGVRARLEYAAAERPAVTPPSHDDHVEGAGPVVASPPSTP